ncbi:MAG: efflux RND transporter permease subunit [Gammaproteobacteria bacterium]|nr:efflux RND transporter permease subunit [Gammaproteobacteria bacterium]
MNLTASSLKNPAGVGVIVAIILLFGAIGLYQLPIQLFPDMDSPAISIQTQWRAASPKEVESELIEPQEEVLRGLPGLKDMQAFANRGGSWISLNFSMDTDMQKTLVEVISRLNRLPPLPDDAEQPIINLNGFNDSNENLSWFFIQQLPGNPKPVEDYRRYIEDTIKPRIEAVPGVASVELPGAQQDELQIVFDPFKAAQLGVQLPQIASLVGDANDVSGGFVTAGRRQYTLRFAGRYTPEQLAEQILDWRNGKPIRLGDVAQVKVGHAKPQGFVMQNGNPAFGIQVKRANGANVLDALTKVKAVVEELRPVLNAKGLDIRQSFDASVFIKRAVNMVSGNLIAGILLSVGVLWWFMRRFRATMIIAVAIPVSLFATFIVLRLTGHNLNVISLAGLAFAVGMVTDSAIVVLENIVRLRDEGKPLPEACLEGATEVWPALFTATVTMVAIFLPVIFLKDAEGQLFGDLALTISIAVAISLFVAVSILPLASRLWLKADPIEDRYARLWERMSAGIMSMAATPRRRWFWIGMTLGVPFIATFLLMPKLDYLPPVRRDAVDAFFNFPPGAHTEMIRQEIASKVVARLKPYMEGKKQPALKNYYLWIWPGGGTIGVRVLEEERIGEMVDIVRKEILADLPDTTAFAMQGLLFGGFGGEGGVQIHLQSRDTEALNRAAREGLAVLQKELPGAQARPNPDLELSEPELRLTPNDQRIAESGWNREALGMVVRALGDGLWLGEHFNVDERLDIILRAEGWEDPEQLAAVPLATPSGAVVPLGDLVSIQRTVGPSGIRRLDGRRTVTLEIAPPEGMSLEEVMAVVRDKVEPKLKAFMPEDGAIQFGGSADSLDNAVAQMSQIFGFAVVLLFLLMAAMFKSAKDSFMVILTIPQATVGGVLFVQLTNLFTFQTMDLLTMIGFIILLGLVVNNAILLVEQTRGGEAQGLSRYEAVARALRLRMRPIFIGTFTNLFGTLPLWLSPGEGSQIYRGLAAAIVGGLSVSTVFTLILLPCLLLIGQKSLHLVHHGLPAQVLPAARLLKEGKA